uniref:Macro domain-containing protein n=1 Tax=Acanthochromis polyacanthus TaxID=80966 RepID=A0A3Q1EUA8_9TELE
IFLFVELQKVDRRHIKITKLIQAQTRLSVNFINNIQVSVWRADLTNFAVDAVVNAANGLLQHSGGLAAALCKAGGPKIQEESNDYVKKFGPLKTGEATITTAGGLPWKKVIHAVGPNLKQKTTQKTINTAKVQLQKVIQSVLTAAENHKFQSLTIPAISSGIFNFPLRPCCEAILYRGYNFFFLPCHERGSVNMKILKAFYFEMGHQLDPKLSGGLPVEV